MNVVKLAKRVALDLFKSFVTERDGFQKEKDGSLSKDKEGNTIPVNGRGNFPVTFDGIEFATDEEAVEYCKANNISVASVVAGSVNDAKGSAVSSAIGKLEIPPTTPINAETFALWSGKAQELAIRTADSVTRPEVSTRAQKAALEAQVSSMEANIGAQSSTAELLAFAEAVKALRNLEK